MSEFLSRVWLATEAVVICAPLTAVIALGVLPEQVHQVIGLRNHDAFAALAVRMAAHAWSAAAAEPSWLGELGWGVPLLVPLLHLCVERGLRSDARGAVRRHVPARLDEPYP